MSLIPGELHLPKSGKNLERRINEGSTTRLNIEDPEEAEKLKKEQALRPQGMGSAEASIARRGHRRSIIATSEYVSNRFNQEEDEHARLSKNSSFHLNTLIDLKKAFDEADQDGSGALDEEEFISAFKNVRGIKGYDTEEQLCHLFMKIDANSDGTVDWDEFTNHILLEQSRYMANEDEEVTMHLYEEDEEDEGMQATSSASPNSPTAKRKQKQKMENRLDAISSISERIENKAHLQHLDMIERITWVSPLKSYLSAGRDGLLKLWSDRLVPQRTIRNGKGWITDIAVMGSQPMAVCSNDRTITFYDTYRSSLDMLGKIVNLDNVPLCCEYIRQSDHDLLIYADDKGLIYNYVLEDQWGSDATGPTAEVEIGSKKLTGMRLSGPIQVHSDWITQFKQQSQSTTLDLITSSMDCHLKLFDLEKRETKWSVMAHSRGVFGFDVCKAFNFIASCGVERDIMLWNPFTGTSIGMLTGHTASVQKIIVNEADNQLISLATDKVIKIWDLRTNKCMQTILDKEHYWPENRITALMFSEHKKCLVSGAVKLKERHRVKKTTLQASNPIIFALYNSNFGQVVTGDKQCTVNVYNVDNSEKVFSFDNVHNTAISAWCFDYSGRRLLTAGQDGSLKMWNFNNGQCLKLFTGFGEEEITCVAYVQEGSNRYVAAGGWNCKVCIWEDAASSAKANVLRTLEGDADDISCMCFCAISTAAVILATGTYDGEIVLWKLDGVQKAKRVTPEEVEGTANYHGGRTMERLLFLGNKESTLLGLRVDGCLFAWNITQMQMTHTKKLHHKRSVALRSMCIDDECCTLFTADSAGYVIVWSFDIESSDLVKRQFCYRAHNKAIVNIDYATKLSLLLTASADGRARLWTTNGIRIGDFGQPRPWRLHAWQTYAERETNHIELVDSDSEVDEEGGQYVGNPDDFVDSKDAFLENEGAYYLEQQRMNFFGAGRKDEKMRRKKRNMNFDLVLQRRLPLKNLSPIELPPSSKFYRGSTSRK